MKKKTTTPRGLKNNNPGNIRLSQTTYEGEVPSTDSAFKQFSEMRYGYRAMFCLLHYYQRTFMDDTIRCFVSRYAPPVENDTEAYIRLVCAHSGKFADERITTANREDMIGIVSAMSLMENGVPANPDDVTEGWELFKKDKL